MDFFTILTIAIVLSFDTFAASLSYGIIRNGILFRQASGVAFVLAFFQGGLTVAGYFLGSLFSDTLKATDHWIALLLLGFLGMKMIFGGIQNKGRKDPVDLNNAFALLTIALGTSIDAFAIGISFAFFNVTIWSAGILIGSVTFLASMTAIRIGKYAGDRLGGKVEIIGGLILIAIGLKIFIEHTLAA